MEQLAITGYDVVESRKGKGIFSLTYFLGEHNLIGTPIDTMLTDLAKMGDLMVAGGEARSLMGYSIESKGSDSNSLPTFEKGLGMHIPYLDIDFRKAVNKFQKEIQTFGQGSDLDLYDFRMHYKKGNIKATVIDKPLRLSIFTPEGSSFKPFKIDIVKTWPDNARFGKCVTTFDGLVLPVDGDLNVQMDNFLFNTEAPLGMMGDINHLVDNYTDPINLAIAVRFLAQSLMVINGHGRVRIHFGKTVEDEAKMYEWMINSLAYTLLDKENNPNLYYKLLYTVIPNWELFDPKIQTIIKNSFLLASKVKEVL